MCFRGARCLQKEEVVTFGNCPCRARRMSTSLTGPEEHGMSKKRKTALIPFEEKQFPQGTAQFQ